MVKRIAYGSWFSPTKNVLRIELIEVIRLNGKVLYPLSHLTSHIYLPC